MYEKTVRTDINRPVNMKENLKTVRGEELIRRQVFHSTLSNNTNKHVKTSSNTHQSRDVPRGRSYRV